MPKYTRLESITDFFSGTEAEWNDSTLIIPENIIIFTSDTHIMKIGDGTKTFAELDVWINFDEMSESSNESIVPDALKNDIPSGSAGKIAILGSDMTFIVSDTLLNQLLTIMNNILNKNNNQTDTITNDLSPKADLIDLFTEEDENKLCIIKNNKYSASDYTLEELNTLAVDNANNALGFYIDSINGGNNINDENPLSILIENTSIYVRINGVNNTTFNMTYSIETDNDNITIENTIHPNEFKFVIGNVDSEIQVTITAHASIDTDNGIITKDLSLTIPLIKKVALLTSAYSSDSDEYISCWGLLSYYQYGLIEDSNGNIFSLSNYYSDVAPYGNIIIKYDSNLDFVNAINLQSSNGIQVQKILIDSNNNDDLIFVCGDVTYTDLSTWDLKSDPALIRVSNDLSTIKDVAFFNHSSHNFIPIDAIIDSLGNIVVIGMEQNYQMSGVLKFDNSFNLLNQTHYSVDVQNGYDIKAIKENSIDNTYVFITFNRDDGLPIVIKLNSDLSLNKSQAYDTSPSTQYGPEFNDLIIDESNELIYIVGYDSTIINEDLAEYEKYPFTLLATLNLSDLSIVNSKMYGMNLALDPNFDESRFEPYSISVDPTNGNILVTGECDNSYLHCNGCFMVIDGSDTSNVIECITFGGGYDTQAFSPIAKSTGEYLTLVSDTRDDNDDYEITVMELPKIFVDENASGVNNSYFKYQKRAMDYITDDGLVEVSSSLVPDSNASVTSVANVECTLDAIPNLIILKDIVG